MQILKYDFLLFYGLISHQYYLEGLNNQFYYQEEQSDCEPPQTSYHVA